jgi:hypothetical protein
MPTAIPTPAERFASLLRWLTQAVAAMSGGDRLSYLLIGLIADRIRQIKQRVARLAARIAAGRYAPRRSAPRRSAPRRSSTVRRPRPPNRLPQKLGWLVPLVPEAVVFRAQLEFLLRDPEMAALLAAAPASLRRPVRSLCWMLGIPAPETLAPILAPIPAGPRSAPRPAAAAAAQAPPSRRPRPSPPHCAASAPTPPACGPPLPA